jgi:hypothetical protein
MEVGWLRRVPERPYDQDFSIFDKRQKVWEAGMNRMKAV